MYYVVCSGVWELYTEVWLITTLSSHKSIQDVLQSIVVKPCSNCWPAHSSTNITQKTYSTKRERHT